MVATALTSRAKRMGKLIANEALCDGSSATPIQAPKATGGTANATFPQLENSERVVRRPPSTAGDRVENVVSSFGADLKSAVARSSATRPLIETLQLK